MTIEQALQILWREVGRSSQSRLADRIGVSKGTITRWRQGASPEGKSVELLLAWAKGVPAEPVPDVLTAALIATGENIEKLATIRGYAQMVLDQLLDTAKRQQVVVDSLAPWSAAEGRQTALNEQRAEEARESVRRAAAESDAKAAPPEQPAKKKRTGG